MKIRKSLASLEKGSYADDNAEFAEGMIDCTQGCDPYGSHPALMDVIRQFPEKSVSEYPHSQDIYSEIISLWYRFAPIRKENIFLSDGSISALYSLNNIFDEPEARVLCVAPSFTDAINDYKARGMSVRCLTLSAEDGYKIDAEKIIKELDDKDSILYLDDPNNPTGQKIPQEDLKRIIKAAEEKDIAVICDEAYGDYLPCDESSVKLMGEHKNLIIIRTFSKAYGMAGMRAGYLLADRDVIRHINKMSNPYCMNELARRMAAEALRHSDSALSHTADFVRGKRMLRAVTGDMVKMAVSDDRVPIALLVHSNPKTNLKKMLEYRGVAAVDAGEFDGLESNAVRLRLPEARYYGRVMKAVAEINDM